MPPPRRRPFPRILVNLLAAYLVPTLVLFSLFAYFAYDLARRDLDSELGTRLANLAASTASQVRGKYLVSQDPSEADPFACQKIRRQLEAVQSATGLLRIYLFDAEGKSLCDTQAGVPIGHPYKELELDRFELAHVWKDGHAVASVLFPDSAGRLYKAGYAPVSASDKDATIVAALRVEAPAAYFQRLVALRRYLITYGALLAGVVVVVSLIVAALLTRPIRRLAVAAETIGKGDLAAPVPRSGGGEIAFLAGTLDEMRLGLRARDERLQMMLAGIAHEVRNPLGGIELYAGILREELASDAEKLSHVRRIERELGHLKAVVSDFLDYARRAKPELAPVELAPLLRELHELSSPDAERAHVTLELDLEDEGARAAADASQIRRAILNLVRNAVQATPTGGQVTLGLARAGGRVRVRVSDTGAGIARDSLERVFTPFYTTKEKGTGLGLAFVKDIVSEHGGTLDVTSDLGQGTTFTIDLPEWTEASWAQS